MSFDLAPVELLASALTAVMLSLPLAFAVAGAAISGPRRTWNWAGLGMGLGLLLGVILSGFWTYIGIAAAPLWIADLVMMLGLLCAIVAGVLVIVLEDGTGLSAATGIVACSLIGLGAPSTALPAFFGLSSSLLVAVAGVVIEAVALVAIAGFLVAGAGRVRALQIGVAAAGIVSALLMVAGTFSHLIHEVAGARLPEMPLGALLVMALVALVIGSVVGGVLDTARGRRRADPAADAR